MINFINTDNYDRHIITMEDPIEYYHKHKKCTVNQPRDPVWTCRASPKPLRRALRMDPDIILVGENARSRHDPCGHRSRRDRPRRLRHPAHQRGVESTIDRIIDVFPKGTSKIRSARQLSDSPLIGDMLSQTLLPKKPDGVVRGFTK